MRTLKLSTEVEVNALDYRINQKDKIITIGSCFAEVLGEQLDSFKFNICSNPFGTIFNPLTISKVIDMAMQDKGPDSALYTQNVDGVYFHHDFHSSFWGASQQELEDKLVTRLKMVQSFLKTAQVLVITLGSAYAYRHRGTNQIVGNCHKLPSDQFVKELLHQDQILISLQQLIYKLQIFNRNLKIVLTVSPVRHTKDTLVLNQVSKSALRLVSHRLEEKYKHISYFPAYEIMIDELRDYRFYEKDLIHPNKMATDHIFQVFTKMYLDESFEIFEKEWTSILQMMNHRPLYGFTPSYKKLLHTIEKKLLSIADSVQVNAELEEIRKRIALFPDFKQTH
jgi:hypothetical protein